MSKLRDIRIQKRLSQARLAALAGIDPATVNQVERGARRPTALTLSKLANALEVSIDDIFEETELPKVGWQPTAEDFRAAQINHDIMSLEWAVQDAERDLEKADTLNVEDASFKEAAFTGRLRAYERYERQPLKKRCTPEQLEWLERVEEQLRTMRARLHALYRTRIDEAREAAEGNPEELERLERLVARTSA